MSVGTAYIPNGVLPHERKQSTGTASVVTFTPPADANAFEMTVETNTAYVVFDGTTPSATNGLALPAGTAKLFPVRVNSIKVASAAAGNSTVNVAWLN